MSLNFELTNKVAVITGGAGVLGSSIALSFIKSGVKVVVLDRNKDKIHSIIKKLKIEGGSAIGFECNVISKKSVHGVSLKVLEKFGRIDILLNAAGGNMAGATIGETQNIFDLSMDEFSKVTELNLNGSVIPSLVFGEIMAKQESGVIINYSSMTVDRVITRVVGYSASKAAIENFTKWMSVEMALKFNGKIRVNAIAPGFFIGNQNRKLLLNNDGSFTERGNTIIKNTPMKRFGKEDELNGAIHFLCSDASSFITGIVLPIDGGFSAYSGV
tara:strand:- start:11181 stop:11996 length:816 start_codon:yes stop_codon:yes gene_type:complete